MRITLNGQERDLAAPLTIADLLPEDPRGHAAAVNGAVVPRARHAVHLLRDGDVVELVTAVQGG